MTNLQANLIKYAQQHDVEAVVADNGKVVIKSVVRYADGRMGYEYETVESMSDLRAVLGY